MSDARPPDQLRAAFVTAARRRRTRRRRRRVGFVAVVVAACLAPVVSVRARPVSATSVEVTRSNEWIDIVVSDESTRAVDVVAELREAGIRVIEEDVATGPSRVGRLTSLYSTSAASERIPGGIRVRADAGLVVVVGIGAPAAPGQPYEAYTDAFAPGEPFGCRFTGAVTVSELARAGAEVGVALRWMLGGRDVPYDDVAGLEVQTAVAGSATEVIAFVAESGTPPDRSGC